MHPAGSGEGHPDPPLRLVPQYRRRPEVREAYPGAEGLIEHRGNVAPALDSLFADYANNHAMPVYGDASPQLRHLAEAHHMTGHVTWYSFLEGLEPSTSS